WLQQQRTNGPGKRRATWLACQPRAMAGGTQARDQEVPLRGLARALAALQRDEHGSRPVPSSDGYWIMLKWPLALRATCNSIPAFELADIPCSDQPHLLHVLLGQHPHDDVLVLVAAGPRDDRLREGGELELAEALSRIDAHQTAPTR